MGGGDGGGLGDGGVLVRAARRSRTESSFRLRSVLAWVSVWWFWDRVAWCWVSLFTASSRRSREVWCVVRSGMRAGRTRIVRNLIIY